MKSLSFRLSISALFFFLAVVGCGGEPGDLQDGTKTTEPAGTSACQPNEASPGQTITCDVGEDFTEDCTVFFGNSLPYESGEKISSTTFVFDEEAGTIDLLTPSTLFKFQDITYCCTGLCEERKVIAEDFPLLPASPSPPTPLPPSTEPPGGEVTPPSPECATNSDCSGGQICANGVCIAPPPPNECEKDDDGDSVTNCQDTCPGTPSGQSVNSSGCAPSQVPAMTVDITAVHQPNTRLGHVKVDWKVQTHGRTLEELYIYSQGWNWFPGEDCQFKIENNQFKPRSLLLQEGGAPLTFGTPKANEVKEMMLSSKKCDNDKCKGGGYSGPAPSSQPPWCRLELKKENGSFKTEGTVYTRIQASGLKYFIYARASDDSMAFDASSEIDVPDPTFDEAVLVDGITLSRDSVILKEMNIEYEGAVSAPTLTGCHATSSHTVATSGGGTYPTDCDFEPSSSVSLPVSSAPIWSIVAEYQGGNSPPSNSGNSSSNISQISQANFAHSAIAINNVGASSTPQPWNKTFTVSVPGIGKTFSRTYKVECTIFAASMNAIDPESDYFPLSPGYPLECDDSDPFNDPCNKDGKVRLTGKASTQCKLYKKKSNGAWKTSYEKKFGDDYPWGIKELRFMSTNPLANLFGPNDFRKFISNPTQKSSDKKAVVGSTQLKRTFDVHEYLFAAIDYAGNEKSAVRKALGFTSAFEVTPAYAPGPPPGDDTGDNGQNGCWFDSWDSCGSGITCDGDVGECYDSETAYMRIKLTWKTVNVKSVVADGWCSSFSKGPTSQADTHSADYTYQTHNKTCVLEAFKPDGTTIKKTIHWGCTCGGDNLTAVTPTVQ